MAITINERERSRRDNGKTSSREYVAIADAGENEYQVKLAVWNYAPSVIGGGIKQFSESTAEEQSSRGVWYVTIVWAPPQFLEREVNTDTLSFEVAGVQQLITHSLQTVNVYLAPGYTSVVDNKNGINVDAEGVPQGVDILIPQISETVNRTFPPGTFTATYRRNMASCVGAVNNDTFRGYSPGEVLLTRVSGSQRPDGNWDVSFAFAISLNATGLQVGDITGIAKDGHDYLSVDSVELVVTLPDMTRKVTRRPVQANVHRVYPRRNFSVLGL